MVLSKILRHDTRCRSANKIKQKHRNTEKVKMSKKAELAEAKAEVAVAAVTKSSKWAELLEPSDYDIPRINVVHKISDINDHEGNPAKTGSLVLDKKWVIAEMKDLIQVTISDWEKWWEEDVPFDDEHIAQRADTKVDRDALEAISPYSIIEVGDIEFMLKGREGVPMQALPHSLGGDRWAIGKLQVRKDAYRQTFKRMVTTFAHRDPEDPEWSSMFTLSTELMEKGKYKWPVPSLLPLLDDDEKPIATPKEVQDFLRTYKGGVS